MIYHGCAGEQIVSGLGRSSVISISGQFHCFPSIHCVAGMSTTPKKKSLHHVFCDGVGPRLEIHPESVGVVEH
jgi:hypothetical protein